jgi:HlyD family secretion protein
MKRILVVLALLVLALGIALYVRMRKLEAYKHAPSGGSGTIEGTELDITARMGARIQKVHVKEGDEVQAGQVLVELDCSEPDAMLAEARARLLVARTQVDSARASAAAAAGSANAAHFSAAAAAAQAQAADTDRSNLSREAERISALYTSGAISSSQMDQVDTRATGVSHQVQALLASEKAARARVGSAWQAQHAAHAQTAAAEAGVKAVEAAVRRAEVAAHECRLLAPRQGVVQTRNFEPGEVVLPGSRVLTVVDLDEVRSTFYLPNAELAAAAAGRAVTVHADPYPGEAFPGTILHVSSKAEFTPRNVQTREDRDRLVYAVAVVLPNPGRKLRPGMPVDVIIDGTGR